MAYILIPAVAWGTQHDIETTDTDAEYADSQRFAFDPDPATYSLVRGNSECELAWEYTFPATPELPAVAGGGGSGGSGGGGGGGGGPGGSGTHALMILSSSLFAVGSTGWPKNNFVLYDDLLMTNPLGIAARYGDGVAYNNGAVDTVQFGSEGSGLHLTLATFAAAIGTEYVLEIESVETDHTKDERLQVLTHGLLFDLGLDNYAPVSQTLEKGLASGISLGPTQRPFVSAWGRSANAVSGQLEYMRINEDALNDLRNTLSRCGTGHFVWYCEDLTDHRTWHYVQLGTLRAVESQPNAFHVTIPFEGFDWRTVRHTS